MARVLADAEETELDGDYGTVMGLLVTCSKCGHVVEVYGTEEASMRRAAVMLREECPEELKNFYVVGSTD